MVPISSTENTPGFVVKNSSEQKFLSFESHVTASSQWTNDHAYSHVWFRSDQLWFMFDTSAIQRAEGGGRQYVTHTFSLSDSWNYSLMFILYVFIYIHLYIFTHRHTCRRMRTGDVSLKIEFISYHHFYQHYLLIKINFLFKT